MHHINLQRAFVLHRRSYRDTSFLIELFMEEAGRISVIAKGVKRPKSQAKGLLQPFVPLLIACSGKNELLTLKTLDCDEPHYFLQGSALFSAFYLNELLMRLLHRFDPHPELFLIYKNTLIELNQSQGSHERCSIALRLFEKSLLKTIGYELPLLEEAFTGKPIEPQEYYYFDHPQGAKKIDNTQYNTELSDSGLKVHIYKGSSLLAFSRNELHCPEVLLDAKRLMRRALKVHLGGRALESRRLF